MILLRYLVTIAPLERSGSSKVTVILSEPVTIRRTLVGRSGIPERDVDEGVFVGWTYVFAEKIGMIFEEIY